MFCLILMCSCKGKVNFFCIVYNGIKFIVEKINIFMSDLILIYDKFVFL